MFFCLLSEEEVKAWKEWKKIALKVPQSVEPSHYFRGKVNAGTCQQWKVFFALLLLKIKIQLSFVSLFEISSYILKIFRNLTTFIG